MKLKAGDEVLITGGKDKGQKGKIEKVFPKTDRVLIPNLNLYKRHRKGIGREKGGIITFSRSLPVASVALLCPHCAKPTRVAYRIDKKGEKARICAKCKRMISNGGERK